METTPTFADRLCVSVTTLTDLIEMEWQQQNITVSQNNIQYMYVYKYK